VPTNVHAGNPLLDSKDARKCTAPPNISIRPTVSTSLTPVSQTPQAVFSPHSPHTLMLRSSRAHSSVSRLGTPSPHSPSSTLCRPSATLSCAHAEPHRASVHRAVADIKLSYVGPQHRRAASTPQSKLGLTPALLPDARPSTAGAQGVQSDTLFGSAPRPPAQRQGFTSATSSTFASGSRKKMAARPDIERVKGTPAASRRAASGATSCTPAMRGRACQLRTLPVRACHVRCMHLASTAMSSLLLLCTAGPSTVTPNKVAIV